MLRRHLNSIFLFGIVILLLSAQTSWAASVFEQALALFKQHDYAKAAPLFEKATKILPENANVYYYQALNFHYLRQWDKAKIAYWAVSQKFPNTEAAKLSLTALQKLGYLKENVATQPTKPLKETKPNVVLIPQEKSREEQRQDAELATLPNLCSVNYLTSGEDLMVDVDINGHPIRMLFDTGAGGVVLGKEQLNEVGLPYPHGEPAGVTMGSSNKSQVPFWIIKADVRLGNIMRHNFPIYVLESNQAESLIGQEFFSCYRYAIDPASSTIRFIKNGVGASYDDALALPFKWETDKMVVDVEVNGHKYPMWFDTGNTACAIHLHRSDLSPLGLTLPDDATTTKTVGITGSGLSYRFYVAKVRLGPVVAENVEVLVSDEDVGGRPLVGRPLYTDWECTVDNTKHVIRFLRR
jgi:predicted aspartyl protease